MLCVLLEDFLTLGVRNQNVFVKYEQFVFTQVQRAIKDSLIKLISPFSIILQFDYNFFSPLYYQINKEVNVFNFFLMNY